MEILSATSKRNHLRGTLQADSCGRFRSCGKEFPNTGSQTSSKKPTRTKQTDQRDHCVLQIRGTKIYQGAPTRIDIILTTALESDTSLLIAMVLPTTLESETSLLLKITTPSLLMFHAVVKLLWSMLLSWWSFSEGIQPRLRSKDLHFWSKVSEKHTTISTL